VFALRAEHRFELYAQILSCMECLMPFIEVFLHYVVVCMNDGQGAMLRHV